MYSNNRRNNPPDKANWLYGFIIRELQMINLCDTENSLDQTSRLVATAPHGKNILLDISKNKNSTVSGWIYAFTKYEAT